MLPTRLARSSRSDLECPGVSELVGEFVSGILGKSVNVATLLTAEERIRLFSCLSRANEVHKKYRPGERLVWTLADLDGADQERLSEPHLDEFVATLRARLPRHLPPGESPWPEGRRFALCLSHDMDHVTSFPGQERWRQLKRLRGSGGAVGEQISLLGQAVRSTAGGAIKRHLLRRRDQFDNVGDWLRLESECGFKSSLFFFAQTVQPWHPHDCSYGFGDRVTFEGALSTVGEMMREIHKRGWDVGVHGSIASATQAGVLELQKREIETVIAGPVLTTRQHYLEYNPCSTPAIQAASGLLADGTQGFNDTLGFRAGTSFPYRVWDWSTNSLLPLWQVPLHIQDGPLLRHGKTVEAAVTACVRFLEKVERVGGCLGLLFHPAHLATDGGLAVYRELLQEARQRGAWGCSMREVVNCWRRHTGALAEQR
jgi:hypothetical protein